MNPGSYNLRKLEEAVLGTTRLSLSNQERVICSQETPPELPTPFVPTQATGTSTIWYKVKTTGSGLPGVKSYLCHLLTLTVPRYSIIVLQFPYL